MISMVEIASTSLLEGNSITELVEEDFSIMLPLEELDGISRMLQLSIAVVGVPALGSETSEKKANKKKGKKKLFSTRLPFFCTGIVTVLARQKSAVLMLVIVDWS